MTTRKPYGLIRWCRAGWHGTIIPARTVVRPSGKALLVPRRFPVSARGVLYVHSCPPAVCPHVEWAAAAVLGVRVSLSWTAQPADPGTLRAESNWQGSAGTADRLA